MTNDDKTIRPEDDQIIKNQSDFDKTIRADEDVISAANDDFDKTIRADEEVVSAGDDFDKTIRADEEAVSSVDDFDKTIRADEVISSDGPAGLDDDKTINMQDKDVITSGQDAPKPSITQPKPGKTDSFLLEGTEYKLVKVLSQSTGEAQIYLVEKNSENFVLKLYYPNIRPKAELLKVLRNMRHENIIEVFSYGNYEDRRSGEVRFYELMEFAAGGDVENTIPIRDTEKLKKIALDAASGLNYCHKKNIIHRDIKPGNFFYKEKEKETLLIADFGISSLLDEETSMKMTSQARSAIFAAPEVYHSIGGKVEIGKEVDYYSLGVSILYLYLGDNPFRGETEFSLMGLKTSGKIPLPDSMPDEIKHMVKGLLTVDKTKRWGYTEINQWYYGQMVEVAEITQTESSYEAFPFDRGLEVSTREEMAHAMSKNPELGVKYLYSGRITKWLENSKDMPGAMIIEEIFEKKYASNQQAGLQAAIYFLDPRLPYIASDGTECSQPKDFADLFEQDFKKYAGELKQKNHLFYVFLNSHGQESMATKFQNWFKNFNPEIALLKAIYSMDAERKFRFEHKKDKQGSEVTEVSNLTELEDAINDHFDDGENLLYNDYIPTWIEHCVDKNLAAKVRETLDKYQNDRNSGVMAARYLLNEDITYWGLKKDSVSLSEIDKIGEYILKHRDVFKQSLKDKNEWVYLFLEARGYNNYVDFAQYQIKVKNHKNKAGIYNADLAMYKIARGFGANVPYTFSNGTSVNSIEELNSELPKIQNEVKKLVQDPESEFSYWLAVFFHEDPFVAHNNAEEYEADLLRYIEYIREIAGKSSQAIKKYDEAYKKIEGAFARLMKGDQSFMILKYGIAIAVLVFGLTAILYNIFDPVFLSENPMTGRFWKASGAYYLLMVVIITLVVLVSSIKDGTFSFSATFFGGPIVGLIAGVIAYYIGYLLVSMLYSVVHIVIIVILALILAAALYKILINPYSNKSLRSEIYGSIKNSMLSYYPLRYAFSDDSRFRFENDSVSDYKANRRRNLWTILLWGVPAVLLLGIAAYFMYFAHPNHLNVL